jgi:glycosyltransferase involved in cell wall biosynthesis
MTTPSVSIIVPYYNSGHYLARLIDSIRGQRFQDFECLLVDDGSKDDSCRVAEALILGDPRFRNLSRPYNFLPGGRGAKNFGFSQSNGEYIVFFDSDDVMYDDFLSSRVECLESDTQFGAAYSDMGWKVRVGQAKRVYRYDPGLMDDLHIQTLNDEFWLSYMDQRFFFTPGNFMWRRSVIEHRQLWHEMTTIGEDYEFHCRKFLEGVQTGYIARPTWDYMANSESMMATSEAVDSLLGRSYARFLVCGHLQKHLGFRSRLVRKELTWQVKILRRVVACRSSYDEKSDAIRKLFLRIDELMTTLGFSPAKRTLLRLGLNITVGLHGSTSRFYALYERIVPDVDLTDDRNRFTIS